MNASSPKRLRHGIVNVWVVLTAFVMLAFVGLAADTAYVYMCASQLQNAADAGALAGARLVTTDSSAAMAKAINVAQTNLAAGAAVQLAPNDANATGGDVVVGIYSRSNETFTPTLSSPNAVQVLARRTQGSPGGALPLIFGPIFGTSASDVSRSAIAMKIDGVLAGVIVLDPAKRGALHSNGTVDITINNGGIQVNSTDSQGAQFVGNASLHATEMKIKGNYSSNGTTSLPGKLQTGAPAVPDPLAALPAPSKTADLGAVSVKNKETLTIDHGYYSGGITTKNGAKLTLNPGIYVLGPPGLDVQGGQITANGVMFYLTKASGNAYGVVNITAGATVSITPPTTDTYQGVSFFQDRNTPGTTAIMRGHSSMTLQGTVYMPSIKLDIGGTSDSFFNQLIVGELELSGTSTLTIDYDGRNPAGKPSIFLVK